MQANVNSHSKGRHVKTYFISLQLRRVLISDLFVIPIYVRHKQKKGTNDPKKTVFCPRIILAILGVLDGGDGSNSSLELHPSGSCSDTIKRLARYAQISGYVFDGNLSENGRPVFNEV